MHNAMRRGTEEGHTTVHCL